MSEPIHAVEPVERRRGDVEVVEPTRAERAIARRSAETRATVPTVELTAGVSMDASCAREAKLGCGVLALVVEAAAKALRAVPRANGAYRDGRYELYSSVNVAVALTVDGVNATPTLLDADERSPSEIAGELSAVAERMHAGEELRGNETAGATFTVVDATASTVDSVTPMLNPPQAAALSVGPVRDVPVVRDGAVLPGKVMTLTLSVDNRILHGQPAFTFLEAIRARLEEAGG